MKTYNRLFALFLGVLFLQGCCDKSKIPELVSALNSPTAKTRNQAALDLANCGSRASKAVSRLSELIYDDNVGVQSAAAYALRKIDTESARQVLQEAEQRRRNSRR